MNHLHPLLKGAAALLMIALPWTAGAADYPATVWPSEYRSLPIAGGGPAEPIGLSGTGQTATANQRAFPFPFVFGGQTYEKVNIGMRGYVSFHPNSTNGTPSSYVAARLLTAENPLRVVAAWWGPHSCDIGSLELADQTLGTAPERIYVIQWNCALAQNATANVPTDTRFQAQLWFFEGSNVIQARYGEVTVGDYTGWNSAFPGEWVYASWGIKPGDLPGKLGPSRDGEVDSCVPAQISADPDVCRSSHFPYRSTIQYGFFPEARARLERLMPSFSAGSDGLGIEVDASVINVGEMGVDVEWKSYLSLDPFFVPNGPANFLVEAGSLSLAAAADGAPGRAGIEFDRLLDPPPGRYYLCLVLDPAGAGSPWETKSSCSEEAIAWGPDLGGALGNTPIEVVGGAEVGLQISIENFGTKDAMPFEYRIEMIPDELPAGSSPAETEVLYIGRVDERLAPGQKLTIDFEGEPGLAKLILPRVLRGDAYTFSLSIDTRRESGDVHLGNNRAWADPKTTIRKPALEISGGSLVLDLPDGECIYGEPLQVSLEVCNLGAEPAIGFAPGALIGSYQRVTFLEDPAAATSPQACHFPTSANHLACEPVGGQPATCVASTCRVSCESDAQCNGAMRCLPDRDLAFSTGDQEAKSCMNYLAGAEGEGRVCQRFEAKGVIPKYDLADKRFGPEQQRFHFVGDSRRMLGEAIPHVLSTDPVLCREALPDLEVLTMLPPQELVTGDVFPIERTIRNRGYTGEDESGNTKPSVEFSYRYYLAPLNAEISTEQIPLDIQSTGGPGFASVARKADNVLTDMVVVPNGLLPGLYRLGLILDPEGELRELSTANNIYVHPVEIVVREGALRIVTRTLPAATTEGQYTFQFVAVGGSEGYLWSARELPRGLEFNRAGVLHGVPEVAGIHSFSVQVQSGMRIIEERVALRINDARADLEVSTFVLPTARKGRAYGGWIDERGTAREGVLLAASGGKPPYRWALSGIEGENRLPQGLFLDGSEGVISGEPSTLARTASFTVLVEDSIGNQASRELDLVVVGESDLAITSRLFAEALSAQPYESCIEASGGDVSAPYQWSIDDESLPPGLEGEGRGRLACLAGTPTSCGIYMVGVSVSDVAGERFGTAIPLIVECEPIRIHTRFTRAFARGETISTQLASNAGVGASFQLVQGKLPAGLSLGSEGLVSGVISEQAAFGIYDFLVEARDDEGRQGVTALSINVKTEAGEARVETREKSGCSAGGGAGGGLIPLLFGMGAMALGRPLRRHRGAAASPRRSSTLRSLLPLAALLVLGAGCSETEEITYGLCHQVACDAGMECDPADGVCKCGGTICQEGDFCSTEGEPRCVSSRCEFVECSNGNRCDEGSGDCVCGETSCSGEERCVGDRRCVVGEMSCEGVSCSEGMRCDPEVGACTCDGALCEANESCLEGSCVEDLCLGVNCSLFSVCDPTDGSCHCGSLSGPLCEHGEACGLLASVEAGDVEDAPFGCMSEDRCADVECSGGTTCDPSDGSCRCGGIGLLAPVCLEGQSCVSGQCRGGNLCEPDGVPVVCAPGLSCDPIDGECKCGGAGGEDCGEDRVCTAIGGSSCGEACTIVIGAGGSCGSGNGCYLDRQLPHGQSFCAAGGPMGVDEDCEAFNDCLPGFFCSKANVCRRLCRPSDGLTTACGEGNTHRCLPFAPDEAQQQDLGYCIPDQG